MTTILCYIALLILPLCSFLLGMKRRSGCKEMHAKLGYMSELALTSPHAWACAQRASSLRYMIVSVVLSIACPWFLSILPAKTPAALAVSALTLVMFETVVMVVVISTVEVSLRKLVHPHAQTESK